MRLRAGRCSYSIVLSLVLLFDDRRFAHSLLRAPDSAAVGSCFQRPRLLSCTNKANKKRLHFRRRINLAHSFLLAGRVCVLLLDSPRVPCPRLLRPRRCRLLDVWILVSKIPSIQPSISQSQREPRKLLNMVYQSSPRRRSYANTLTEYTPWSSALQSIVPTWWA